MKKFYICAVLGLVFASCSSEKEVTNNSVNKEYSVNTVSNANWMDVMEEIEMTVESIKSYKSVDELIAEVEYAAASNTEFQMLVSKNYVSPTAVEVNYVMQTTEEQVIGKMDYSTTAKQYLEELIVDKVAWSIQPKENPNLTNREIRLLSRLGEKHDPDDEWDKKKPLALAYGYQNSIGKAIVMGVIAKEFEKVK